MRTVFGDWDRANLETFFVELPMTHTIHIHTIVLISNDEIQTFFLTTNTKVYLFQPLTTLPQIFVGNAEMLSFWMENHLTFFGGSPPSMFHLAVEVYRGRARW